MLASVISLAKFPHHFGNRARHWESPEPQRLAGQRDRCDVRLGQAMATQDAVDRLALTLLRREPPLDGSVSPPTAADERWRRASAWAARGQSALAGTGEAARGRETTASRGRAASWDGPSWFPFPAAPSHACYRSGVGASGTSGALFRLGACSVRGGGRGTCDREACHAADANRESAKSRTAGPAISEMRAVASLAGATCVPPSVRAVQVAVRSSIRLLRQNPSRGGDGKSKPDAENQLRFSRKTSFHLDSP